MAAIKSAALIMPGVLAWAPGTLEEEALVDGPRLEVAEPCERAWGGRDVAVLWPWRLVFWRGCPCDL